MTRVHCALKRRLTRFCTRWTATRGRSCIQAATKSHRSRTSAGCRSRTGACIWGRTIACCTASAYEDRTALVPLREHRGGTNALKLDNLRRRSAAFRLGKSRHHVLQRHSQGPSASLENETRNEGERFKPDHAPADHGPPDFLSRF